MRAFSSVFVVLILSGSLACGDDDGPPADSGIDSGIDCSVVGCAPPPPPGETCTAVCGCCSSDVDAGPTDAGEPTDGGGDVACDVMTCGPGEYCLVVCTCCGIPTGDGGPEPSADYSCEPIPAACSDVCDCPSLTTPCGTGTCTGERQVSCPCA